MKHGKIREIFLSVFLDDEKRAQKQLFFLEIILGAVGTFMSILNVFTHKNGLLLSTLFMAVFSFINAYIVNQSEKNGRFCFLFFSAKMYLLFTYFIVFGGTEGFSTIWLLLLPACGMFAFGRRNGAILSFSLLAELVLLFYTPLKDLVLQCHYTGSFLTRFPVVYVCFFAIGYFLEYVRELTYSKMDELRQEAKEQSLHDALTGVYNRLGFDRELEQYLHKADQGFPFALLVIDIDGFKNLNDGYGHTVGDSVLKHIAQQISAIVSEKGSTFRWGGDEFAVLLNDSAYPRWEALAEEIRIETAKSIKIDRYRLQVTFSIGGAASEELPALNSQDIVVLADKRLYKAKTEGKNRCVFH